MQNITIGRASTVHASDEGIAVCGASMRRNSHGGAATATRRAVDCRACLKALEGSQAAIAIDRHRESIEWTGHAAYGD